MCAAAATSRRLALSFLVSACGGARGGTPPPATKPVAPAMTADASTPPNADKVPTLDAIAARGAVDAPQMKEVARWDRAAPRSPDLKADRDLCVRVAFAASGSVRVRLETAAGDRRGEPTSGADGLLPPQGPVCVTRGEVLRLVVEGDAAIVRAVVFGAP